MLLRQFLVVLPGRVQPLQMMYLSSVPHGPNDHLWGASCKSCLQSTRRGEHARLPLEFSTVVMA